MDKSGCIIMHQGALYENHNHENYFPYKLSESLSVKRSVPTQSPSVACMPDYKPISGIVT